MSEKLSANFTVAEYVKSQTATRHGIDNSLSEEHLENAKKLFANVVQPIREKFGVTIITSGYRSPEHNNSVSSTGLDGPHTTGIAVDIATNTQSQYKLLNFALNYEPKPTGIGIAKTFTHLDWLTPDVSQKYVVRPNVWKY